MSVTSYRRHLPHIQPDGAVIFVTFRVSGSLPEHALEKITNLRKAIVADARSGRSLPEEITLRNKRLFAYYDDALQQTCTLPNHPGNVLHIPEHANALVRRIRRGVDLKRFILHRYCIMPNHVHLLIEPLTVAVPQDIVLMPAYPQASVEILRRKLADPDNPDYRFLQLDQIMKGLKGSAARDINLSAGRTGQLFQQESFDHYVRSLQEYHNIIDYINQNPVAAGLCATPGQWPYTGM